MPARVIGGTPGAQGERGLQGVPGTNGSSGFHFLNMQTGGGPGQALNVSTISDILEINGDQGCFFPGDENSTAVVRVGYNNSANTVRVINSGLQDAAGHGSNEQRFLHPNEAFCVAFNGTNYHTIGGKVVYTPNQDINPYAIPMDADYVWYGGYSDSVFVLPPASSHSAQHVNLGNFSSATVTVKDSANNILTTLTTGQNITYASVQGAWRVIGGNVFAQSGSSSPAVGVFSSTNNGLVPAPGSGDGSRYLSADGSWRTPSSGSGGVAVVGTTDQTNAPGVQFLLAAENVGGVAAPKHLTIPAQNAPLLGCFAADVSPFAYMEFVPTPAAPQYAFAVSALPTNWTGSDISLTFCTPSTSGSAVWKIEAAVILPNGTMGNPAYGTAATLTQPASSTANGLVTTLTASNFAVPSSGNTAGGLLSVRISRSSDSSDTLADVARLVGFTLSHRRSS